MAHFGDKFGRKNMFMLSILLMVLPTFTLAFIPGYETLGFLAPFLLILIRIFQGIAIGGELPGAWVFVREHCKENQKAFSLSCLNSAMALGILLGSMVFLLINAFLVLKKLQLMHGVLLFLWVEFLGLFLFICVDFCKKLLFLNKCKKNEA